MAFRLMPREESFFDMLEKASENLDRAGKLLVEILRNPTDLDLNAKQMKTLEEDGDKIVHEVMDTARHFRFNGSCGRSRSMHCRL